MSNRTDKQNEVDMQITLNRRKVLKALRSGHHIQARGHVGRWQTLNAPVCFMGLVRRVVSESATKSGSIEAFIVGAALGIHVDEVHSLVTLNDDGISFSELAERLEAVFQQYT